MKNLKYSLILLVIYSSCTSDNFREIKPDNKLISYIGRFYFQNSDNVISDWPGTYFRCIFSGKNLGIRLEGSEDVKFNVFVDDLPVKVISCNKGGIIWVAEGLEPRKHELRIYKRTESFLGKAVFKGFVIDSNGKLFTWKNSPQRHIEYIGNSITCGYGVEGASRHDSFKAETENNYLTYAAILARTFNADYSIIAHSGLGIVRHYGDSLKVSADPQMPVRYLRTLDNSDSLTWDFSSWRPDMVVINLGTNDFSTTPYPDKDVFQREYEKLIQTIISKNGNVKIFCVTGPLIGEPCFSYVKETVDQINKTHPEFNVSFIGVPKDLLNCDEDFGSDEHPSVKGQEKMAEFIAPAISKEMGWEFSAIEK
jgi:lysophospholipase L1-like esterase